MEKIYTIEQAIANALAFANLKSSKDLLVWANDDNFEEKMLKSYNDGDPESVYSIINLYSDHINNDGTWEEQLEDALYKEFGMCF